MYSYAHKGEEVNKKDKKAKKDKVAKEPAKKKNVDVSIDILDLRVGKIVKVGPHPDADSLYLEEIDLGEENPRQVGEAFGCSDSFRVD